MNSLRTRLNGEEGFSLAELLIAIAILGMVLGGIVGVLASSLRTYTRASSQEEAQTGVRIGVDRMASELRFLGAFHNGVFGAGAAITAATPTSITFLGDLDGDSVNGGAETTATAGVAAGAAAVTVTGTAQQVTDTFDVYGTAALNDWVYIGSGATREVKQLTGVAGTNLLLASGLANAYPAGSLVRSVETVTYAFDAGNGNLDRTLGGGAAETIVGNVTNLALTYFDAAGAPTAVLANIREIQISLTTQGTDGSPHTMMTRMKPWSLQ